MSCLAEAGAGLGYGFASALVPIVNAEAYAVIAARHSGHALPTALALAFGQSAGKLLLFESARRGNRRLTHMLTRRRASRGAAARAGRWAGPIRRGLSRRRTGLPIVFLAASVGVPPLLLVSLAAGAAGLRHWEFAIACFIGRAIRFVALALPASLT